MAGIASAGTCHDGSATMASTARSDDSPNFSPRPENTLMPLSANGLCDADRTTPRSKSSVPARYATAGVGATPMLVTSAPSDEAPVASASSSHSPDSRVSRPTMSRAGRSAWLSCPARTMAAPSRVTVSRSSGHWPATPRTPSVPNSLCVTSSLCSDVWGAGPVRLSVGGGIGIRFAGLLRHNLDGHPDRARRHDAQLRIFDADADFLDDPVILSVDGHALGDRADAFLQAALRPGDQHRGRIGHDARNDVSGRRRPIDAGRNRNGHLADALERHAHGAGLDLQDFNASRRHDLIGPQRDDVAAGPAPRQVDR